MNYFIEQITPALTATLITILVAFIGYVGKEVVRLIPILVDLVVAKIGLTNYQKLKLVAFDVWRVVDEHFRVNKIIGDTIQAKIILFETLIKRKIPGISDGEIESIRQAIAGEVNKDKALINKSIE